MAIRYIYLEKASIGYNPKRNDYGNTGVGGGPGGGGRSGWYVGSLTSVQNKVEQIKKIGTSISLEQ